MTWETLVPYLRWRINGARCHVRQIRAFLDGLPATDREKYEPAEASWRGRFLDPLVWFIPLVREMRRRPALRAITPMLSMEVIQLMGPARKTVVVEAIGERRFRLRLLNRSDPGRGFNVELAVGGPVTIADTAERFFTSMY